MAIRNNTYSVVRGLLSTISTNTVSVTSGAVKERVGSYNTTIASATASGTTYTYTTSANHSVQVGDLVQISGVAASATANAYSGVFVVKSVPAANQFTVTGGTNNPASPAGVVASNASVSTTETVIAAPSNLTLGSGSNTPVTANNIVNTIYSISAAATASKQRIDVLVLDYSGDVPQFGFVKGAEVDTTATPSAPSLQSNQIALASFVVGNTTVSQPIDQRDTAQFLPIRAFNRSQGVRIGGQKIATTSTSYVDLDDVATRKQYGYHSAIGAVYPVGALSNSNNTTGVVISGGTFASTDVAVTGSLTSATVTIAAANVYNRDTGAYVSSGTSVSVGASAGLATTSSVNVLVFVDASTGVAGSVVGTAAATGSQLDPALPAGKIALGKFTLTGHATTATASNVVDLRPRP